MTYLFLFLGLWRSWLGGGIGKDWPTAHGLMWVQYVALVSTMFAASGDWRIGAVNASMALLLARGYGHGPMLGYPLNDDPDGDFILKLVGGAGGGTPRWFSYAGIRYVIPGAFWSLALALLSMNWWGPSAGAASIIVVYYIMARLKKRFPALLPTFTTLGDEAANWSELIGWTLLGIMLMIAG